jgi:hypothetical protein
VVTSRQRAQHLPRRAPRARAARAAASKSTHKALHACGKQSLSVMADLEANPYEALGLGSGSAELTMAEIKKARARRRRKRGVKPQGT